ncbi:putative ABC transport system permease protein [Catalinimonas alkaloidigena]|uniref:ABC transporter permease n=1 Tax=Catalinimonas alkaloidigena TaxID=1075417 RepID=UPI00240688EA|nr:ABC transporter permease [Catalinimonas alkaloidigena]MDF9796767.1 putative ABC transport system permease protein [Catalinimonas alkaloidigena]
MLRNYFTTAWRNLIKNKGFSFINIFGLATGIAAFVLIFQYVQFELNYDTFQEEGKNIYRVGVDRYQDGELESKNAFTVSALGPAVINEIPGIEDYFRLSYWSKSSTLIYQPKDSADPLTFKEEKIIFADPGFVRYFSLNLLAKLGDSLLSKPHQVIMSQSSAQKYFGDGWQTEALNKLLTAFNSTREGEVIFEVVGVFKDIPQNSHLDYDIIFSHATLPYFLPEEIPEEQRLSMFETTWGPNTSYTYLVLNTQMNADKIGQQLTEMIESRNKAENMSEVYRLQPIRDIHLHSALMNEPTATGNINWVYAMGIIALFTLGIAWINYVNLSTARAVGRAREVGLRKVVGAKKVQLLGQFLLEVGIINAVALVLAVTLIQLSTPYFNQLSDIAFSLFSLEQGTFWIVIVAIFIFSTLLIGIYPAMILSSFRPAFVLKNQLISPRKGLNIRKVLVVFQFAISMTLIIATIVIYGQISFMRTQALGFDTSQRLVIEGANVMGQEISFAQTVQNLRNAVLTNPFIKEVSAASYVPGETERETRMVGRDEENVKEIRDISIDANYFPTMDIKLLAGRNFSEVEEQNHHKVILNQAALRLLDFGSAEEAIGENFGVINFWGVTSYEIIGIVPDFHQNALQNNYEPIAFFNELFDGNYIVQIDPSQSASVNSILAFLKASWEEVLPNNPFNYYFLDTYFNRQYQADERFGRIFSIFSVLAILIACLGLLGLSSFTAVQRSKEIGIRKVMGASVSSILTLLSKDFLKLIFIAGILALPFAYWMMHQWLQNYAFRIDISWWLLILPLVFVLMLALLTVSVHTIRAALTNPTESLRYE